LGHTPPRLRAYSPAPARCYGGRRGDARELGVAIRGARQPLIIAYLDGLVFDQIAGVAARILTAMNCASHCSQCCARSPSS